MRRVVCEVQEIELEGDFGPVDGVRVTCSRCGHGTESRGRTGSSIRRCLAVMREECPEGENNFYVADGDE